LSCGGYDFFDDHELNRFLIATWQDTKMGDKYVITENYISYHGFNSLFMDPDIEYAGTIEYISNFSDNAGVIIIKYDDYKPTYYTNAHWTDEDHWMDLWTEGEICHEHQLPLKGNYIGIYYRELRPGVSAKIGGAYVYGGAEQTTLNAAKKAFTLGNEGTYMGEYGTYSFKSSP
jgi:hypothetical protein